MSILLPGTTRSNATFIDTLTYRAELNTEDKLYTFLHPSSFKSDKLTELTYSQLHLRAQSLAATLQQMGIQPGERVMLIYAPGLEFIVAYFGCLYAGVIAVPAYPPANEKFVEKLEKVMASATPILLLSTQDVIDRLKQLKLLECLNNAPVLSEITQLPKLEQSTDWDLDTLPWLTTDEISLELSGQWEKPEVTTDSLAFLQYTSGSTGVPKGVMVSHHNLLHNSLRIHQTFGMRDNDVVVSWLPPYHDMGLIGCILQPLFAGCTSILMSPMSFLKSPSSWLRIISEQERHVVSGGPNFAYDYCVKKIKEEDRDSFDLSRWDLAFNGAEPIRHETLNAFYDAFKKSGFRKSTFYPCYGLAEATLLVSGNERGADYHTEDLCAHHLRLNQIKKCASDSLSKQTAVISGTPVDEIKIVDPLNLTAYSQGQVGEIWLISHSVAQGYWGMTGETLSVFNARLADDPLSGPYLRTGDLGYITESGRLCITGRLKDLIIIHGVNHYPQNIEHTVGQCHPAIRANECVSFSINEQGEEHLAIICEIQLKTNPTDYPEIIDAIGHAVIEAHEIPVFSISLIPPKKLLKTTSGKMRRTAMKELLLSKTLDPLFQWSLNAHPEFFKLKAALDLPQTPTEKMLCGFYEDLFGHPVGVHDDFFSLGGDSLIAVQIIGLIETHCKVQLETNELFDTPTISQLAQHVDELDPLHSLQHPNEIVRQTPVPLSYPQQRLWFLAQMNPEDVSYNLSVVMQLHGPLDKALLEQAFNLLAVRHEVLRTCFRQNASGAYQHIYSDVQLNFIFEDLRALSADKQKARIKKSIKQYLSQPFDLKKDPLVRMILIQKQVMEHECIVVVHHIIADGWSLSLFCDELSLFYNALLQKENFNLPKLPYQYADYSCYQRLPITEPSLQQGLTYWQNHLQGAPTHLNLPTDKVRPTVATRKGKQRVCLIPLPQTEALKHIAKNEKSTLFMVLLSVFSILLERYSGQNDFIVGTAVANRRHPAWKKLIGFFVNTLALRIQLNPKLSFIELLQEVKHCVLGGLEHQDIPFDQVVDALGIPRDLSTSPLVQVMLVLQSNNKPQIHMKEISAEVSQHSIMAQFDLTLECEESPEGLVCKFQYATDLFSDAYIERLMKYWGNLIAATINAPDLPTFRLSMFDKAEYDHIVYQWNDTTINYQTPQTIHGLFELQVTKTPDDIALVFEEQSMTYRELNEKANQLAHALIERGVRPETLVAVCLDRSTELVIALLAIIKAGGAYVPIDIDYPAERMLNIITDAQASIVFTQEALTARFPTNTNTYEVILIDTEINLARFYSKENPNIRLSPMNLAYAIYTSGSTGKPKGVLIEHRAIVDHLNWYSLMKKDSDVDKYINVFSFGFDGAVGALWWPLIRGDQSLLASSEALKDPQILMDFIHKHKGTSIFVTPRLAEVLLESFLPQFLETIETFMIGGEVVSNEVAQKILSKNAICLYNVYGPTECSVITSYYRVLKTHAHQSIPIGMGLTNTYHYILTPNLTPAGVGIPGELYIAGECLSRGYLNRPDLTAERFIANPFSSTPGARMYYTGDLCCYRPDGNIEYLGRLDHQVKIRGFRIELGEIEVALQKQHNIDNCVVLAREDIPGEKRLVAYLIMKDPSLALDLETLRSDLKQSLPDYMIPAAFITIDSMPLTSNGKLDRAVLPIPEYKVKNEYIAPRNMNEEVLCRIFAQVLHLQQVGIHDNFFALGGDSILVIQIVYQTKKCGLQIKAKDVFQYPTIAELAEMTHTLTQVDAKTKQTTGSLPLGAIQRWFFEQNYVEPNHFNQAMILKLPVKTHVASLEKALTAVWLNHPALFMKYNDSTGDVSQSYGNPTPPQLTYFTLDGSCDDNAYIEEQAHKLQQQLNITHGPLFQLGLFVGHIDANPRLLLIIHHLVIDGISWRILLEEIETAYNQLQVNQDIRLPEEEVSYKDWLIELENYNHSNSWETAKEYWENMPIAPPALPMDFVEGKNTIATLAQVPILLNESDTDLLLHKASKTYRTQINDLLITALILAVYDWTGNKDINIDMEGHGRDAVLNELDMSRTVGWFTSLYPVYLSLHQLQGTTINIGEAIKLIKEQLRAVPDKGLGYGLLRYQGKDLDLAKKLEENDRAQIVFNYLGQFDVQLNKECLFQLASEGSGMCSGSKNNRQKPITIDGGVQSGHLHLTMSYSREHYHDATMAKFATQLTSRLKEIITYCMDEQHGGYTPSDFDAVVLTQHEIDTLIPADTVDIYPVLYLQSYMLHYSFNNPGRHAYHTQFARHLFDESLDLNAFKASINRLVERYPSLRTVFLWRGDKPWAQVVKKSGALPIIEHRIDSLSDEEQEHYIEQLLQEDLERGFDVKSSHDPLFRCYLLVRSEQSIEYITSIHHAVIDGWSSINLVTELLRDYFLLKSNALASPPEINDNFKHFVSDEQDPVFLQQASQFWQEKIPYELPNLELPQLKYEQNQNEEPEYLVFDNDLVTRLTHLSKKTNSSIKAIYLSALIDTISHVIPQEKTCLGLISNGRTEDLADSLNGVGLYWNIVPFYKEMESDKLLQTSNIQISLNEMTPYTRFPLNRLLNDRSPEQVLMTTFNFINLHHDSLINPEIKLLGIQVYDCFSFPLNFNIAVLEKNTCLKIDYDQRYFDRTRVKAIMKNYQAILEDYCAQCLD